MFTVAILAQGTSRAVADTQAFLVAVRFPVPAVACAHVRAKSRSRQQWRIARWVRNHGLEESQRSNPLSKPPSQECWHAAGAAICAKARAVFAWPNLFWPSFDPMQAGPIPPSTIWPNQVLSGPIGSQGRAILAWPNLFWSRFGPVQADAIPSSPLWPSQVSSPRPQTWTKAFFPR